MKHIVFFLRDFRTFYRYCLMRLRSKIVRRLFETTVQNLDVFAIIEGARTSAIFERNNLRAIPAFSRRKALFQYCLAATTVPDGLYLEFGTYKGDTINTLAKMRPDKQFFSFDSFDGLPETWTMATRKGAFDTQGRLPPVRKNVTLIKGFFEHSLPPFVEQHGAEKIAFLHIDCDLYSSTKTVLENLQPMLTAGTIICFDEFYSYPEWQEGEYKAFIEFIEKHHIEFEYTGYIRTGQQVAVKLL